VLSIAGLMDAAWQRRMSMLLFTYHLLQGTTATGQVVDLVTNTMYMMCNTLQLLPIAFHDVQHK
jgi:hypothetical protein